MVLRKTAVAGQKSRKNYIVHYVYHADCEDGLTVVFFEDYAVVHSRLHFCDNRTIATDNADHLISIATQLESTPFFVWASVVLRNAPCKQRGLIPGDTARLLEVTQFLKLTYFVQQNKVRHFIGNAEGCVPYAPERSSMAVVVIKSVYLRGRTHTHRKVAQGNEYRQS